MRKKDQILCVTIPYSKGWKATVNGKRAKIYKANGMFMGIVMKKGTQSVKLDYETPGLKIGACISLGAWIGLGIYGLYFEKVYAIGSGDLQWCTSHPIFFSKYQ